MATDVVVPEVGETGMNVTLVRWCIRPGETVAVGDILFELDTDKTVVEVEAWTAGTLVDLRVAEGDVVAPRQVIARILAPGEHPEDTSADLPSSAPAVAAGPPGTDSSSVPGVSSVAPTSTPDSPDRIMASPRARRLAQELGVDLASVTGSGTDGLITERDVTTVSGADAPA